MWTETIDPPIKNQDGLTLTLTYHLTDGVTTESFTEPRVSDVNAILQTVQNAVNYKNRGDAQKGTIAALDVATIPATLQELKVIVDAGKPKDPDPTAEQLALAAFQKLLGDYRNTLAAEKLHLPVQTASADILVQIQSKYQPGYLGQLGVVGP